MKSRRSVFALERLFEFKVDDVKNLLFLSVLLIGLQINVISSGAEAQTVQKFAVLDLVKIRLHSLAGKSIGKQITVYRKAYQKDAEGQQKRLKAAQRELRLQRSLLSPEAMRAREREFKDEVAAVQRRFQVRHKALDKSRVEALKIFEKNLMEVLRKVRADRKFDMIIKKRPSVIYANPSIDITGEIMKRINQRLKKITVKNPVK